MALCSASQPQPSLWPAEAAPKRGSLCDVQGAGGSDALEGTGPQRRPQKRVDRQLEEVAEAVGGGYCR